MISFATTKEVSYRLDFLKIIYLSNDVNLFFVYMVYSMNLWSWDYVYNILRQKFNQLFEQINKQETILTQLSISHHAYFLSFTLNISIFDIVKFCGFKSFQTYFSR